MLFSLIKNLANNIQLRESHVIKAPRNKTKFTCLIIKLSFDCMNTVYPVKKSVILEKSKTLRETIYSHIIFYLLTSLKHVKICNG